MTEFAHFGRNLRFYRTLKGITQHQLANTAELVDQTAVSRFECGLVPSDHAQVDQLARALGVSVDALLRKPRVVRHAEAARPVVVRA